MAHHRRALAPGPESMVAESSQGTGFLLEGPSARSATNHPSANHQNFPGVFRYYGGYASTPTQPRRALTRSPVLANPLSSRPSPPSAQVEARTRRTIKQTHRTQETRVELQKSAFTRATHTRTVKLFFFPKDVWSLQPKVPAAISVENTHQDESDHRPETSK